MKQNVHDNSVSQVFAAVIYKDEYWNDRTFALRLASAVAHDSKILVIADREKPVPRKLAMIATRIKCVDTARPDVDSHVRAAIEAFRREHDDL